MIRRKKKERGRALKLRSWKFEVGSSEVGSSEVGRRGENLFNYAIRLQISLALIEAFV